MMPRGKSPVEIASCGMRLVVLFGILLAGTQANWGKPAPGQPDPTEASTAPAPAPPTEALTFALEECNPADLDPYCPRNRGRPGNYLDQSRERAVLYKGLQSRSRRNHQR